jgi:hypothetical protein
VYELEGSVTGVVHLDCNLAEHTLQVQRANISRIYSRISVEYTRLEYLQNMPKYICRIYSRLEYD